MATWTVAVIGATCGSCGCGIRAGDPMQLLTVKRLIRCVDHATEPVNWQEVDLERARVEMEREREAMQRPETGGGPERLRPARVKSFKQIGELFDPKLAQTGERE